MDLKNRAFTLAMLFLFLLFSFPFTFIEANRPFFNLTTTPLNNNRPSSIVLPIRGTLGRYNVSLNIGDTPKSFELEFDTAGDLSWIECDAPCVNCKTPIDKRYKPHKNIVACADPLCAPVPKPRNFKCVKPNDPCNYFVKYADKDSTSGVIVQDNINLKFTNNVVKKTSIVFGCGYDQTYDADFSSGILGLGNGKSSILSQLHNLGLIANVVGHCLREKEGFIFLGDEFNSAPGIVWAPMLPSSQSLYTIGPANILFNEKPTSVTGLELIFDTGSTYTYLNDKFYQPVFDLVTNGLPKTWTEIVRDESLPICWKGPKPFRTIGYVRFYFKPLALTFTSSKNVQFELPPESYLSISEGKVCLGILKSSANNLRQLNIIGDIFFLDKLVVYDNEKKRIGWVSRKCA
ncbi:PREDICTED: aspartic proteinase Asp1-like [Lupinus angustifolius]|uniref:aspartic proteinase Asp1-like n=1 Tax=Lupinus angustifolius TaxID=3871 RepID=UPI00092EA1A1|nr:PREDICTED: aspartic proteinase Asp1-like [Lupinus angustifolius]